MDRPPPTRADRCATRKLTDNGVAPAPAGSGPRHLAFHPSEKWAYLIAQQDHRRVSFHGFLLANGTSKMAITNAQSGTRIDEIEEGIFRIHTPIREMPGGFGFSFNQYLVVDDEPLLFHTGPRKMFPLVREAIASVLPVDSLRWIAFSHVEADECGGLNEFLAAAPKARPLCSHVGALVSVNDLADREARGMEDGETITLGRRTLTWLSAPHLPHGWDCGFLADVTTHTLFCGDLFTQPGADHAPVSEGDILGPSEQFRKVMDYYAHAKAARPLIEKLAATQPRTLACMHGSAWRGDGAKLLRALGDAIEA